MLKPADAQRAGLDCRDREIDLVPVSLEAGQTLANFRFQGSVLETSTLDDLAPGFGRGVNPTRLLCPC
ncbi:MAG: hypothetical protein ACFCD0_09090 [Gemmataceae bacterium]